MWILVLNCMHHRMEQHMIVCRARSKEALEKFVEDNKVEPYRETEPSGKVWTKFFKKGSILELYNPPESNFQMEPYQYIGYREEYVTEQLEICRNEANAWYDNNVENMPDVG